MNVIALVAASALFGAGYLLIVAMLGEKVARIVWRGDDSELDELRSIAAPMIGVLVHFLSASLVLLAVPSLLPWLLWVMLAVVLIDFRGTLRDMRSSWRRLGLVIMYGLVCFAVLMSFHVGAARGDNLLWSIYNLTAITPGDSPQGLLQAQYLLHDQSLTGPSDFSLFDRPFLGGIVSLAALTSIGQPPGPAFNDFPLQLSSLYIALWVWLNATFALTVDAIARRFAPTGLRRIAVVLVLAAPFVVFNIIGAWPKLFATYATSIAALLAIKGRWHWAAMISGMAFFAHGSFLWPHLSMCGLLALYIAFFTHCSGRFRNAALVAAIAVAFPVLWFVAERYSGAATPLRAYYLYSVPVNYGLSHDATEIARQFYTSTSPENLAFLPFMNLLKALLPNEMLIWLVSFSINGSGTDLRRVANALFYTQFNRPLFAFCLTAGVIAVVGFWRGLARNWQLALATSAFFLLPLLPGLGLYRRDDHFITPVMVSTVLPLLLAFCMGLGALSKRGLMVVATLIMAEYASLYWSRYPGIRYEGDFFEYYLWLCVALGVLSYVVVLQWIRGLPGAAPANARIPTISSSWLGIRTTPARLIASTMLVVLVSGWFAPLLTQRLLDDGGFERFGWRVDLSRWTDLRANRDGQPLLHTDLRTTENGIDHREVWINSGQSLIYRNVPATSATSFSVWARVHPAWSPGVAIESVRFQIAIREGEVEQVTEVPVVGPRDHAGEWQRLSVALAKFSGKKVDIEIRPLAAQSGTWTLWRDPAIAPD